MYDKLIVIAHKIVVNTFDYSCYNIDDLIVEDKTVKVVYEYSCCGEYGHESVLVPLEWFDEGFNYVAAYKEMKCKEREEEQRLQYESDRNHRRGGQAEPNYRSAGRICAESNYLR